MASVHQAALDAQLALERVHASLEDAMSHSGKIAWHPPEALASSAQTMTIAAGPGATIMDARATAADLSAYRDPVQRMTQGPGL